MSNDSEGEMHIPLSEYEPETAEDVVKDISNLCSLGDLSAAEAWAWYGVEVLDETQTDWADQNGLDQSTVSKSVKRAREKMETKRIPLVGREPVQWDRKYDA